MNNNQISDKQLEANKQNAKLGGVKTPEGREKSRENALKHGLTSKIITPYDKDIDVENFESRLKEELSPNGIIQELLFERILVNYLRLYRITKIEKDYFESLVNPPRVEKVYENNEELKKYEEGLAEYKEKKLEVAKDMFEATDVYSNNHLLKSIPQKPKYKMVSIQGYSFEFDLEKLKELADLINRYYISGENRFYKSLNEFLSKKQ